MAGARSLPQGNLNSSGMRPILLVEPWDRKSQSRRRSGFNSTLGYGSATYVRNPGGIFADITGAPLGNPHFPCVAGPEILPLADASVPVDTGTGYIFDYYLNSSGLGATETRVTAEFAPFTDLQNHLVAFDLYDANDALGVQTDAVQIVLPLNAVSAGGAGSATIQYDPTVPLSGTNPLTTTSPSNVRVLACLGSPNDGNYLRLDAATTGHAINMNFDYTRLVSDWGARGRIVKMQIRYIAWRDDSDTGAPGAGFSLGWIDALSGQPGGCYVGAWLVGNHSADATYEVRDMGEVNPTPIGKFGFGNPYLTNPSYDRDLADFTVQDLANLTLIQINALLGSALQTFVYFDFIELVVHVVPEHRVAHAVRVVSNCFPVLAAHSLTGDVDNAVTLRNPINSQVPVALSAVPGTQYHLVLREAYPASNSDYFTAAGLTPAGIQKAPLEAVGPPLQLLGVLQARQTLDPQISTRTGAISDGQLVPATVESFESYNLAAAHYTSDATLGTAKAYWPAYRGLSGQLLMAVWSGGPDAQQIFLKGGTTYNKVRALIKADPLVGSATLYFQLYTVDSVTLLAQTGFITAAAVEAQEDVGFGWREVEITLSPAFTPASDAYYAIYAKSDAAAFGRPWYIAAAEPPDGDNLWTIYNVLAGIDLAMVLVCANPAIPAPTVTTLTLPVTQGIECTASTFSYMHLAWTPDGSYDQYAIVMREVANPANAFTVEIVDSLAAGVGMTFDHYWPFWDVSFEYLLVGRRFIDAADSTSPVVTSGAASTPQLIASAGAVLGLVSDTDVPVAMLYAPTSESGPVQLQWTDQNPSDLVYRHGQDFAQVLTSAEDRGQAVALNVLVDHLAKCALGTPIVLTKGQRSLRFDAYDTLMSIARQGRVFVLLPGGGPSFCVLTLGTMTTTTEVGVHSASLQLISAHTRTLSFRR